MELEGLIIKGIGGFYYIQDIQAAGEIYECRARGIFRKEKISPVVGDRVKITVRENGENTVDEIFPRKNLLSRPPLANIDRLIIIVSSCEPRPSCLAIDKLTVLAEYKNIEPIIVFTKSDLKSVDDLLEIYKKTGVKAFSVCSKTGEGIEKIKPLFKDNISALTGNSGVGKSTLLNAVAPSLSLETGSISDKLGRGRHTTRRVELFKILGGYVADTPGFSALDVGKDEFISKEALPFYFKEFKEYLGKCKFSTCSHINDKGCKILEAADSGRIPISRHKSYAAIYGELKNIKEWEKK